MEKEIAALPAVAENDKVETVPFNVIQEGLICALGGTDKLFCLWDIQLLPELQKHHGQTSLSVPPISCFKCPIATPKKTVIQEERVSR